MAYQRDSETDHQCPRSGETMRLVVSILSSCGDCSSHESWVGGDSALCTKARYSAARLRLIPIPILSFNYLTVRSPSLSFSTFKSSLRVPATVRVLARWDIAGHGSRLMREVMCVRIESKTNVLPMWFNGSPSISAFVQVIHHFLWMYQPETLNAIRSRST